jgi:hypothetical protein
MWSCVENASKKGLYAAFSYTFIGAFSTPANPGPVPPSRLIRIPGVIPLRMCEFAEASGLWPNNGTTQRCGGIGDTEPHNGFSERLIQVPDQPRVRFHRRNVKPNAAKDPIHKAFARQLHITDNFTLVTDEESGVGISFELADEGMIDL